MMQYFNESELEKDPLLVLQLMIKSLVSYTPQDDFEEESKEPSLPNNRQAKEMLTSEFKKDDPAKYYNVVGRLGKGAFAEVMKVIRKSDNAVFALKSMIPKN